MARVMVRVIMVRVMVLESDTRNAQKMSSTAADSRWRALCSIILDAHVTMLPGVQAGAVRYVGRGYDGP